MLIVASARLAGLVPYLRKNYYQQGKADAPEEDVVGRPAQLLSSALKLWDFNEMDKLSNNKLRA